MKDQSSVSSSQEPVRKSSRQFKPSKAYDNAYETGSQGKGKGSQGQGQSDSRGKRDQDKKSPDKNVAKQHQSKTQGKDGARLNKSATETQGKDGARLNKSATEDDFEVSYGLPDNFCITCNDNKQPILRCGRCADNNCISCLNIPEPTYEQMFKIPGFVWLCTDCMSPGIKSMRQDKEIEERCAEFLSAITTRVDKVEAAIKKLPNKTEVEDMIDAKITTRVDQVETSIKKLPSKTEIESMIDAKMKMTTNSISSELSDRERRKTNLIVHNLPESEETDSAMRQDEDLYSFEQICGRDLNSGDAVITRTTRLGKKDNDNKKPRPLRVTFQTTDHKTKVLRNSSNLQKSTSAIAKNLRIHPDLTPHQQKEEKELRDKLKVKRNQETDKNVEWFIKRGEILSRLKPQQDPEVQELEDQEEENGKIDL
jgi:hypothetical protein